MRHNCTIIENLCMFDKDWNLKPKEEYTNWLAKRPRKERDRNLPLYEALEKNWGKVTAEERANMKKFFSAKYLDSALAAPLLEMCDLQGQFEIL
jgi:hypothetical protein